MRPDWVAAGFRPEDEAALRLIEFAAKSHGIDKARLKDLYANYRAAPHTHGPEEHAREIFDYMQRQGWPEGDRELIAGWIGNVQSYAADFGDIPHPPAPPRIDDVRERDRILDLMRTNPAAYREAEQIALYEINERLEGQDVGVEPERSAEETSMPSNNSPRQPYEDAMRDGSYWRKGNEHWADQYRAVLEQEEASTPNTTTGPADTGNGE